jgi:hypothetical protein
VSESKITSLNVALRDCLRGMPPPTDPIRRRNQFCRLLLTLRQWNEANGEESNDLNDRAIVVGFLHLREVGLAAAKAEFDKRISEAEEAGDETTRTVLTQMRKDLDELDGLGLEG